MNSPYQNKSNISPVLINAFTSESVKNLSKITTHGSVDRTVIPYLESNLSTTLSNISFHKIRMQVRSGTVTIGLVKLKEWNLSRNVQEQLSSEDSAGNTMIISICFKKQNILTLISPGWYVGSRSMSRFSLLQRTAGSLRWHALQVEGLRVCGM